VPVSDGTLSDPVELDLGSPIGSRTGTLSGPIDLGSLTHSSLVSSPAGPVRARTGTLVAPVSISQSASVSISQADNPNPIPSIYGMSDSFSAVLSQASQAAQAVSSPLQQVASTFAALSVSVSPSAPAQETYLPSDSPVAQEK